MYSLSHRLCRFFCVAVTILCGAFAATGLSERDPFSEIDGAKAVGGAICTYTYTAYDCSDCMDDQRCGQTRSAACQSYTGPFCLECQLGSSSDCPGPTKKYMPETACGVLLLVNIPQCPTRQYVEGMQTGCDGACS